MLRYRMMGFDDDGLCCLLVFFSGFLFGFSLFAIGVTFAANPGCDDWRSGRVSCSFFTMEPPFISKIRTRFTKIEQRQNSVRVASEQPPPMVARPIAPRPLLHYRRTIEIR